jgi:hypothetical protein
MAANIFIGLAVTSHNPAALCTAVFDNISLTTGSNAPPTVSLTSPTAGASFTAPATVPMTASAADSDGTVSQVTFLSGASTLGSDTSSPYSFSWTDVPAGSYTLTARATDDDGTVTTSSPVPITVGPASGLLPGPWVSQDVGAVGLAGSASHSSGTFTLQGAGADIWDSSDKFHFVHRPLSGDGSIVARVVSMTNTNSWAKAGVMIRESLAPNSSNAMMLITPVNGLRFQRRTSTGASSTSTSGGILAAPFWVRLVRSGNTLTGFKSPDGVTWTQVGSESIPMAANIFIGLAVTSHNPAALCTAVFDNVSVP